MAEVTSLFIAIKQILSGTILVIILGRRHVAFPSEKNVKFFEKRAYLGLSKCSLMSSERPVSSSPDRQHVS
jgi:hypothetical protein